MKLLPLSPKIYTHNCIMAARIGNPINGYYKYHGLVAPIVGIVAGTVGAVVGIVSAVQSSSTITDAMITTSVAVPVFGGVGAGCGILAYYTAPVLIPAIGIAGFAKSIQIQRNCVYSGFCCPAL